MYAAASFDSGGILRKTRNCQHVCTLYEQLFGLGEGEVCKESASELEFGFGHLRNRPGSGNGRQDGPKAQFGRWETSVLSIPL